MCATKQRSLENNRMSLRRIIETFGPTCTRYPTMLQSDFVTLTEFARNGITPPVAPNFVPESDNIPPLRERY
jgi:leucyl-tRNA synthetase